MIIPVKRKERMSKQEQQTVALMAAKEVCKAGYSPKEAEEIVRMDDHTFLELVEWYEKWGK